MALCDVVSEYGKLDDTLAPRFFSLAADFGVLSNAMRVTLSVITGSSGAFADHIRQVGTSTVSERGRLRDGHDQTGEFESVLSVGGRLRDGTTLFFQNTYTESAALSESIDEAQPAGVLEEHARLFDTFTPIVLQTAIDVRARLSDAIVAHKSATLSDAGTLTDATAQSLASAAVVIESGALVDALVSSADTSDVLRTAMRAAEAQLSVIHGVATLSESATISDVLATDIGGAWSAPLETFAMSRWELAPFNSIAEIDGALYAASDDGLYRLGVQHEEAPIVARIRGGLTDFGLPTLQRASYFYASYTSEGTLAVTVGYIPDGEEQSVTCTLPPRLARSPTPGRAKLGRGMRSRYWRITVENTDGADFVIFDQRVVVDSTNRRV
jgi:hypothetical protein